mmetsp:Transcript_19154/g.51569  ORF Transcript_19154/g.51569 Transcript_19154/m.51569 type:complete len:228 (-) Transcript_19154:346-1029(-)|eukprot:CAMPEP_0185161904 /NCGR_PEP_ID=MMETSP1139-20130426/5687_1 /TAXON_ID=298111 /ORGANISM="Pavlova sp., Strain CCMP459" /LENGTH=227 /DNA_ID=CAMNT_0027727195 /DNA_START=46 /DNA_END=729 /DNA_ORIENTATION=-
MNAVDDEERRVEADAPAPVELEAEVEAPPTWRTVVLGANWTPWLTLAIAYTLYFICALGLTWVSSGAPLVISTHVVAALLFALACGWNMLHTPSHGNIFRRYHVAVGWTAMASGVAVVVGGYWIILSGEAIISPGAQIAFMITGALQIFLQGLGVYFARIARSPERHMMCMTIMFYNSLLLPAVNRLPQLLGLESPGVAWTFGSSAIGFAFAFISIYWNMRGGKVRV